MVDGFTGGGGSRTVIVTAVTSAGTFTETFTLAAGGQVHIGTDIPGYNAATDDIYSVTVESDLSNGGGNFRVNNIQIGEASLSDPDPIDYGFTVTVVDADGDAVSQDVSIHLDGSSEGDISVETPAIISMTALAAADTQDGTTLDGTSGDDILIGGDGNDIIYGGLGDDILTGGDGDDIFVWKSGDSGTDTVSDFTFNADPAGENDVLDLSDLLVDATDGTVDQYIYIDDSGINSTLYISSQGNMGSVTNATDAAAAADQVIQLEGVTGVDLSTLINGGNLNVDNS